MSYSETHRAWATFRGGSWNSNPVNLRASNRNRNDVTNRNNNLGFRCVWDARTSSRRQPELARVTAPPGVRFLLPARILAYDESVRPNSAVKAGRVVVGNREARPVLTLLTIGTNLSTVKEVWTIPGSQSKS